MQIRALFFFRAVVCGHVQVRPWVQSRCAVVVVPLLSFRVWIRGGVSYLGRRYARHAAASYEQLWQPSQVARACFRAPVRCVLHMRYSGGGGFLLECRGRLT
jgi:hypothetical protein